LSLASNVSKPTRFFGSTCAGVAATTMLVAILLAQVARQNALDLDVFHQMALIRASLNQGRIPIEDVFAYTSAPGPSIHYEWGNGAVLYVISRAFGGEGLLALKYILTAITAALALWVARRRRADWAVICAMAPPAILLITLGFTAVRASLFTLMFTAVLLVLIEFDRRGSRRWIWGWFAIYVAWLNIHPGFVVGAGILALYWLERLIRLRELQWHLIATGLAMAGLVLLNPYGFHYSTALWHAYTMRLPPIPEWLPMWRFPAWWLVVTYGTTILVAVYAIVRAGWTRIEGVLILLACAAAACQHVRHVYLYALVWLCYVPGWLSICPLGQAIQRTWARHGRGVAVVCLFIAAACVPRIVAARPWRLQIPAKLSDVSAREEEVVYPAGAVQYLEQHHFHGNVMTHYNDGSYVMWHLWPDVKIGMDSRNDVGYTYECIMEILSFYKGKPGWRETLVKYPTDVVLINRSFPLAALMADHTGWHRVYRDDSFELWARPQLEMPIVDRSGEHLAASFP
jgi:hypothetical protein